MDWFGWLMLYGGGVAVGLVVISVLTHAGHIKWGAYGYDHGPLAILMVVAWPFITAVIVLCLGIATILWIPWWLFHNGCKLLYKGCKGLWYDEEKSYLRREGK